MTTRQPLLPREIDELAEAVAHAHVVELPLDDLVERRRDRLELARDHIAKRQVSFVQPAVDLRVHLGVAEVAGDRVQQVHLRDGAVEVDGDRAAAQKCEVTPAGSSSAFFASLAASGSSYQEYA